MIKDGTRTNPNRLAEYNLLHNFNDCIRSVYLDSKKSETPNNMEVSDCMDFIDGCYWSGSFSNSAITWLRAM